MTLCEYVLGYVWHQTLWRSRRGEAGLQAGEINLSFFPTRVRCHDTDTVSQMRSLRDPRTLHINF